jgi:hypothetical protein
METAILTLFEAWWAIFGARLCTAVLANQDALTRFFASNMHTSLFTRRASSIAWMFTFKNCFAGLLAFVGRLADL